MKSLAFRAFVVQFLHNAGSLVSRQVSVLLIEILSEGHSDPLSNNLRVKQPELGVTTLK